MEEISAAEREELVAESLKDGMAYPKYQALVGQHAETFTSTGHTQTETLSNYTQLNERRMSRWGKRFKLTEEQIARVQKLDKPLIWLVLTESWCGDAAHTMPVMHEIAMQTDQLELLVVLRDDHPRLMEAFLTNGNKSIPKLIAQDPESGAIVFTWGPRPAPAAAMVVDCKKAYGTLPPEFKEDLQRWYNKDKGYHAAEELLNLLQQFIDAFA